MYYKTPITTLILDLSLAACADHPGAFDDVNSADTYLSLPYTVPPENPQYTYPVHDGIRALEGAMKQLMPYATPPRSKRLTTLLGASSGADAFKYFSQRLRFADDELQRMENEGGGSPCLKQTAKADDYFGTRARIKATDKL